jgi:hypothetical protein
VLSAMAPEIFPTVRAERTTARFEFIAKGRSTRVRLVQTGWKQGEEWDKAYDYLATGNAQLLEPCSAASSADRSIGPRSGAFQQNNSGSVVAQRDHRVDRYCAKRHWIRCGDTEQQAYEQTRKSERARKSNRESDSG